ncbi:MAG TPA: TolC family protein [Candidatus Acidoferrales bacterium]|nr:TolC family protein [Candidatus Acidoferrales bacterium]
MNLFFQAHWFVVLATLATLPPAFAQPATNAAEPLSLADAKRLAVERNWDLLTAKSGVDAAEAQWLITKEFPNPSVGWNTYKIGATEGGTPLGNGVLARSYDTIAAVSQLIEIGGKRKDRQAAARQGVLGSKARFLDAKRTLEQGVTKAYVAALLADENERVLHQSSDYMRHEQDIAEARFNAGDLAESDLKQIQVAAEQYVLQEKAAETAAVQARTAVEVLLGVPEPKGDWRAADSLAQVSAAAFPETELSTNALRPDVLAAETDLRSAEENLKLAKAMRIPDPTFSVGYEHDPPGGGPPVDTLNIGMSFPLPIWNQNKGAIDAARATVEQSRLAFAKLRAQMNSDLVNAEAAFDEASSRLKRYREQIAPQSASARESVIFKFNKGAATLVDLLEAERTDNDVRLALAQAMADTASTAADLTAASTTLTETDLSLETEK